MTLPSPLHSQGWAADWSPRNMASLRCRGLAGGPIVETVSFFFGLDLRTLSCWTICNFACLSRRGLKDGDLILNCTGMRFTSRGKLLEFLSMKGNTKYADRVVRVTGVQSGEESIDIFCA